MPLFGTLSTMPLTDLLQWLASARLTGTLQIERDKVSKAIVFHDGQIIGCSSDDPPERLGQFLIARGKITEEQLRHALTIQESSGKHLGMTLVEMGSLSPDELSSHLEAKAEETIFSLFDWEDALFRFQQGTRDESNVFPISLRVDYVLLRGLKRFDEIQRIREVLYDPRLVLKRSDKELPQAILGKAMANSVLSAIDGDRTLAEIRLHVHGSEFVVNKFLFELYQNGFVRLAGIKKIEPVRTAAGAVAPVATREPAIPTPPSQPAPVATSAQPAPEAPVVAPRPAPQPEPAPPAVPAPLAVPAPQVVAGPDPGVPIDRPPATAEGAPPSPEPSAAPEPPAASESSVFGDVEIPTDLEPADQSEAFQLTQQLEATRGHMRKGEFEAALIILEKVSSEYPGDESLRRLTAEAEAAFIEKAYRHFLPPTKIPKLTAELDTGSADSMSPTEFFLLSRIDGTWNVKSIVQVAPLREADTLRALKRMRETGLIELFDPSESC